MSGPANLPAPASAARGPRNAFELFVAFSVLSMQGFGGVLGVVQRELVERRGWLTHEQFIEEWALAQVLPGPNVCNLALMYGQRQMGGLGALAALGGLLALPLVTLVAVASTVRAGADLPGVRGALSGMGAVTAGVIAGAAFKLLWSLRAHTLGAGPAVGLAMFATGALSVGHWPLLAVVALVGGLGFAGTVWHMHRGRRS